MRVVLKKLRIDYVKINFWIGSAENQVVA